MVGFLLANFALKSAVLIVKLAGTLPKDFPYNFFLL